MNIDVVPSTSIIIEVGCGTGSFTVMLSQKVFPSKIIALDMDEKALTILADKISQLKLNNIILQKASVTQLPFDDSSFDVMYSSLLFCNLSCHEKLKTIKEAKRVLKNHGRFLIADWGKPQTLIAKAGFIILQYIGGRANTIDMKKGMLKYYLQNDGFYVSKKQSVNTWFGTIDFYAALKSK